MLSLESAKNSRETAIERAPRSSCTRRRPDEASLRLKNGLTPLVIEPLGPKSSAYHYDPTRPDASAARQVVDDVLQRASGRVDPRSTSDVYVSEPGSRYIDFLNPWADRAECHGRGALGNRVPGGELPDRQAAEAVRRDADAETRFPAGPSRRATDIRPPRLDRALCCWAPSCSRCRSAATLLS